MRKNAVTDRHHLCRAFFLNHYKAFSTQCIPDVRLAYVCLHSLGVFTSLEGVRLRLFLHICQ